MNKFNTEVMLFFSFLFEISQALTVKVSNHLILQCDGELRSEAGKLTCSSGKTNIPNMLFSPHNGPAKYPITSSTSKALPKTIESSIEQADYDVKLISMCILLAWILFTVLLNECVLKEKRSKSTDMGNVVVHKMSQHKR